MERLQSAGRLSLSCVTTDAEGSTAKQALAWAREKDLKKKPSSGLYEPGKYIVSFNGNPYMCRQGVHGAVVVLSIVAEAPTPPPVIIVPAEL